MKKKAIKKLRVVKKLNHRPLVFKLRVTITDVEPEVYRVLYVPGSFDLGQLHMLIQMSFGWCNTHLHDFKIGTKTYIDYSVDEGEMYGKPMFDERSCIIGSAFSLGEIFQYTYDFGDNWDHEIEVQEIEEPKDYVTYPYCSEGRNACPPEDCGGANGYEEFKANLKSKNLKKKHHALWYAGGQFDPFSCDPNRINRDMIWRYDWRN